MHAPARPFLSAARWDGRWYLAGCGLLSVPALAWASNRLTAAIGVRARYLRLHLPPLKYCMPQALYIGAIPLPTLDGLDHSHEFRRFRRTFALCRTLFLALAFSRH